MRTSSRTRFAAGLLLLLLAVVLIQVVRADDALPPNLGRGLRPLVEWRRAQPAGQTALERHDALVAHVRHVNKGTQVDASGNVVVDVRLTGEVAPADVKKSLLALGLTIIGEHVATHLDKRDGVLSARMPLAQAETVAKVPGVQSVLIAHRGRPRAGEVPGQGVPVLHADEVQAAGFDGTGITVGVLSDSYDQVSPHAAADVASGDLPSGVVVLQDDDDPTDDTDEGRAMLQIVHDVAPGAKLAFCTSGDTQTTFANNIQRLRTDSSALCDIIIDDIGFEDEPFFSDGIVSEAVDAVVTSSSLNGKKAIYYSASGNDGSASYNATFLPVSDADARSGSAGGSILKFEQVPSSLTDGGWQNFKGADLGRGTRIVQKVTVMDDDGEIDFQWDDPFDASQITADYNILVFDAEGNYHKNLSGIDNNYSTGEAVEFADLPLNSDGSNTVYYLAITRSLDGGSASNTNYAHNLRYFVSTDGTAFGKYIHTGKPTLYGHSAAANADGVAAYDVHDTSVPEYYDSFGPVTIYFDTNGNRLSTPIIRDQPTMAAVDGVDTTFFPQPADENDTDGDGYPNFYGTSAAAPHAGGVAALLLQAAGGPQTVTAAHMRSLLESTAGTHDLDPAFSSATLTSADGQFTLTLTANGDDSNNSAFDSDFFHVTFTGPAGASLKKLGVDLGPSAEDFDPTTATGYPFTIGDFTGVDTSDLTETLGTDSAGLSNTALALVFPAGAFPSGASLDFGIDRDQISTASGGNDADYLGGSTVKARFVLADGVTKVKVTGTFQNKTGKGYSPDVGYGLINAYAALLALQAGQ